MLFLVLLLNGVMCSLCYIFLETEYFYISLLYFYLLGIPLVPALGLLIEIGIEFTYPI